MSSDEHPITRTSTALLEGLRDSGDESAWREFEARYRPLVFAVARRLGLQDADAEDAAQETLAAFVQAYREHRYDREKGRLRQWLRGIACHKVRDLLRRRGREVSASDRTDAERMLEQVPDAHAQSAWDDEWSKAVLRDCLEQVRGEVEPQTFEAFLLFALREWPARRVAEHLQISEAVVYQSKSRVLKRVRELIGGAEEEIG
jgi:RNA polymerase sigma-70 factor (ECF subfamily)